MRDPFANPEPLIKRVYAYVAYRIGDGHEAEDVTSETFARALRYRDSFDPRKGDPAAWLVGIARRCIADAALEHLHTTDEIPDVEAPGDVADRTAARIDMTRELAHLDERERELLALRYGADLTARQIGELLGLRTNAVEVALHRALGTLRERLAPDATDTRRLGWTSQPQE